MDLPLGWLWLLLAVALWGVEAVTGTFMFLLFGLAAALTSLVAFLGLPLVAQTAVFLLGAVLSVVLAPALCKRVEQASRRGVDAKFGVDALIGKLAVVTEAIDPLEGKGMVRVGADLWRARADVAVPVGTRVCIAEVEGTKVTVYPAPPADAAETSQRLAESDEPARQIDVRAPEQGDQ